jgi:hypothetical protein
MFSVLTVTIAAVVLRVVTALSGGYWLSAAAVIGLGRLGAALGMHRADAVVVAAMLGFLIYLGILIWAFSKTSLGSVLLVCGAVPALSWWVILW